MAISFVSLAFAESDCKTLRLVNTGYGDNVIANKMLTYLLASKGVKVKKVSAESPTDAYRLLKHNEADFYLTTWVPLDNHYIKPYLLDGSVKTLGKILEYTQIGIATNYAADNEDIFSLKQIAGSPEIADKFQRKIYVGEQDWYFANALQRNIRRNLNGLSQFKVIRLHNFDLRKMLENADKKQEPVLFFARRLSFVGYKYAAHFLYDTQGDFNNYHTQAAIYSSARYAMTQDCPVATGWVSAFSFSEREALDLLAQSQGRRNVLRALLDIYNHSTYTTHEH